MANLRQIAKESGVSVTTVSRVLNNDETFSVSPNTRNKVLLAAETLGYTNSKTKGKPKSIRNDQKKYTIGIIQMHSLTLLADDPYYYQIEASIESNKSQYTISTVNIQHINNQFFLEDDVPLDGIFAIGVFNKSQITHMKQLCERIVFLDASPDDDVYYSVIPNFQLAVEKVVRYFLQRGHTSIGFIGEEYTLGGHKNRVVEPRLIYFKSLLTALNLYNPEYVIDASNNVTSGYNQTKHFLEQATSVPTAIFVASDSAVNGVIRAFVEKGYRIPEDISIITFNNTILSEHAFIPLTSVAVNIDQMVITAFKNMIELLESPSFPTKTIIPCYIVERDSVAPNTSDH